MLTLWGPGERGRYCDGLSRRSFLQIGGLAMGGSAFPTCSRRRHREQTVGQRPSHKSVIMVYLSGGLAHQDTFDLKPDAPAGIRGEFKPIATRLPGVQIGELLPRTAAVMDKLAVIRSLVGLRDEHSSFQNLTGFPMGQSQREGKPNFGSVIARMQGPVDPVVPPFVDLFPVMQHRPYNSPGPASWATPTSRHGWTATTWRCSGLPPTFHRSGSITAGRCSTSSTSSAARSKQPKSAA